MKKPSESTGPLRHCQEIYELKGIRTNGVQLIKLDNGDLKEVYCQMSDAGGGWTLIQRRQDGKESFERNWAEYANGFGSVTKDFWLGNSVIHRLTSAGERMELRLDVKFCDGQNYVIHYDKFMIESEKTNFSLVSIANPKYHDHWQFPPSELLFHNGNWEFSTVTDSSPENCVKHMGGGGWWYNACGTMVNLNGKFGCHQPYPEGNFMNFQGIKLMKKVFTVSMMLRPFNPTGDL